MKFKTQFTLLATAMLVIGFTVTAQPTSITITNASGGVNTYLLAPGSLTTNGVPVMATTPTAILASVPAAVSTAAAGAWNVFKNFSITNPISVGVFGLQNGPGRYGIGIEAAQQEAEITTNTPVDVGFGLAAIQAQKKAGQNNNGWNFYSATVNIGVSQIETIPVLNIPFTLRVFSGPFTSLNGGVLIGEESGISGDFDFQAGPGFLSLGGGVVNDAGAAAASLKPVMPMAHINYNVKF